MLDDLAKLLAIGNPGQAHAGGDAQGRLLILVIHIHGGAMFYQIPHDLIGAIGGRTVHRREAVIISGINIGAPFDF